MSALASKSLDLFRRAVHGIERADAPWWYFVFTFLGVVFLRTFLEFFSSNHQPAVPAQHLLEFLAGVSDINFTLLVVHYVLFYTAIGLTLLLALHAVTKEPISNLFKVIAAGFLVLCIVPMVDLLVSGGRGFDLSYLLPELNGNLLYLFVTFFGPLTHFGVSPGMRLEVLLVVIASFFYAHIKGLRVLRRALTALCVYTVIFLYIAFPYVIEFMTRLSSLPAVYTHLTKIGFFLSIVSVELFVLMYLVQKKNMLLILRDLRFPRLAHYWLMFGIGLLLVERAQGSLLLTNENIFHIPMTLISIAAAWGFSVVTNNITDVPIDTISNRDRPLIASTITAAEYRTAAWILLTVALVSAASVNLQTFFLIALFIGNYFLYSMPPLRLKRVPYFSKLAILFNSLALMFAGFAAYNTLTAAQIAGFLSTLPTLPAPALAVAALVLLLAMNFIDIKDYEGDKQAGVHTLPVLLGLPLSKVLIGAAFLCLYLLAGMLLGGQWFLIAAGLGLLQFYIINKKDYQEAQVFMVYLPSIVALFFIL